MKLTIEIDTAKGEHKTEQAIALLGGSVLLSLLDSAAHRDTRSWEADTQTTEPTPTPRPSTPAEPEYAAETTDCHGMLWNGEIHSSPPSMNADGSWRARRGRKDEYDAAIAAHKAAQTAPEPTHQPEVTVEHSPALTAAAGGMPVPAALSMPAAPAPTTPPAPIAYETMGARFMARFTANTLPVSYEQIYADLGVVNPADPTNQSNIDKLWHYLDGLDDGMDHAGAVRHALGSV